MWLESCHQITYHHGHYALSLTVLWTIVVPELNYAFSILGAKSVELIYEALNKVYPVLRNFRKLS